MKIGFRKLVHTFSLDLKEIPEGFSVELIEKEDKSYEVWLYNKNCILSDGTKKKMLITSIPGTLNGKSVSLKKIRQQAEKRLINSKYRYDEIEEYTEVYMDQKTYNKFFGMIKTA